MLDADIREAKARVRADPGDAAGWDRLLRIAERAGRRGEAVALLDAALEEGDRPAVAAVRAGTLGALPLRDPPLEEILPPPAPDSELRGVTALAFDATGSRLAAGREGGEVEVFDLHPRPAPDLVTSVGKGAIEALAFTHGVGRDGIVVFPQRGKGMFLDLEDRRLRRGIRRVSEPILAMRVARDDASLVLALPQGRCRLGLPGGDREELPGIHGLLPRAGVGDAGARRVQLRVDTVLTELGIEIPTYDLNRENEGHVGRGLTLLLDEPGEHGVVWHPRGLFVFGRDGEARRLGRYPLPAPAGGNHRRRPNLALGPGARFMVIGSPSWDRDDEARGSLGTGARVIVLEDAPREYRLAAWKSVAAVALAPDGSRAALGTADGEVRLVHLVDEPAALPGGEGRIRASAAALSALPETLAPEPADAVPLGVGPLRQEGQWVLPAGATGARLGRAWVFASLLSASVDVAEPRWFVAPLADPDRPFIPLEEAAVEEGIPAGTPYDPVPISPSDRWHYRDGWRRRYTSPDWKTVAFTGIEAADGVVLLAPAEREEEAVAHPLPLRVRWLWWSPGGSRLLVLYENGWVVVLGRA